MAKQRDLRGVLLALMVAVPDEAGRAKLLRWVDDLEWKPPEAEWTTVGTLVQEWLVATYPTNDRLADIWSGRG